MLKAQQVFASIRGNYAIERKDQTLQGTLPSEDRSIGVAAVWAGFYTIIAIVALLQHVGHQASP
jgi:hypothetical protein